MNFQGVVIEEGLHDKNVLQDLKIMPTKTEPVTQKHKTPWLKHWTLHTVEVSENKAQQVAKKLSEALEPNYWYIDFKNASTHFIIFPHKIFKVDRSKAEQYQAASVYGLSLNVPDYQLDFSPNIAQWQPPKK